MAKEDNPHGGISPELREKLKEVESKSERPTQIRRIKRLQELQDKLEHSHKIKSLKDIEKKVLYPQIIGIIFLFPVILHLSGATLDPFYSPLVYPLLMVFIWLLVISLEWFVFRLLEIRHHPSKSTKCIMAKNSIKRAVPLVVVAIIVFSLLYTPYMADEIEARTAVGNEIELQVEGGEEGEERWDVEEVPLVSRGRFGFRRVRNLTIHGEYGTVNVSLQEKETGYSLFEEDGGTVSLNRSDSHTFADFSEDDFLELVLRFNSTEEAKVRYEFNMEFCEDSRFAFAVVSFFYLAAFTEWIAVQYPIKKKYSGVGIYQ